MNILIVPSWYKTKSNPTLGSFFYEQAKMLRNMGHTVIIADVTFQSKKDYFSGRCYRLIKENEDGIIVYSYVVPSFGRFNSKNGGINSSYKNLNKVFRKILKDGFEIDLIHAHSYLPAGVIATRLAKEYDIPIVVTEHSSELLSANISKIRMGLLTEVVESCSKFICVSNKLKEKVLSITECDSSNVIVIPNMVDPMFSFKSVEKKERFTFVSVGNLINSKRFDLSIDAFSKTFKENENVELKIIGNGPLRKELEEYVKKIGEEKRIKFLGRLKRDDVVKCLQESECLLLPSDYETFGVVYIEAMAVGNPVIATKNGGAEDIITKDNGILIDRDNLEQLCCALRYIFNNINCFDRKFISQSTLKKYGQYSIGSELQRIYLDLIETHRRNK